MSRAQKHLLHPYRGMTLVLFNINCSRGCARRKLCFHVENCEHADQKQLTRPLAFHLDMESTHGHPASCRARPANVADSLEDVRWIRGLECKKLPTATYAFFPNLQKKTLFLPLDRDRDFLSSVFYTAAPKYVCITRLTGARHLSPAAL